MHILNNNNDTKLRDKQKSNTTNCNERVLRESWSDTSASPFLMGTQ